MPSDTNEVPLAPRFQSSLDEKLPIGGTNDPIIMHDHQRKAGGWSGLGKRRSLRKKASQNFFGLINSCLSPLPNDQGFRRGRGRPRKQRSYAPIKAPAVLPPPVLPTGSNGNIPERVSMCTNAPELVLPPPVPPTGSIGQRCKLRKRVRASHFVPTHSPLSPRPHDQGLRRGRGRPRKQRSDAPTKAPAVPPPPVLPTGSNGNIPERVLISTNAPEIVPPPPVLPTGSNGNIPERVLMYANVPELVLPPPAPPTGSIGQRCKLRKRVGASHFVPTYSPLSPRPHGQGLRRGPGRPRKQRSDAPAKAPAVPQPPVLPTESNGNIPERVLMSTNAPELVPSPPLPPTEPNGTIPDGEMCINTPELVPPPPVPPTGSNGNIPERVFMRTNVPELVPPPPVPPMGPNGNIPDRVSMNTNAPELVAPPPVPPTGSNGNILEQVLMSTNAPELVPPPSMPPLESTSDWRETRLNIIPSYPLLRLKTPEETHTRPNVDENYKKLITDEVQSVLTSHLTSGTTISVDDMIISANSAFETLNWIGADYGSFHKYVKNLIADKYNIVIAERERDMWSISELEKINLDFLHRGNDIDKEIEHDRAKLEMYKENKEASNRQIEDAEELICRLKRDIADFEKNEKCVKDDEQKHIAARGIIQAEKENNDTKMNAARVLQREIERRRNEALQRIESTTQHLLSYVKKDRDK